MIMVYWRYKAEPGEGREGMYMDWEKVTVTEVTAVRTIHFTKGAPIEVKERKHWGLAFTDDGELTYRHRGRETRFGAGSAVLLPRGQSYTILRHKEGDFHVIDFDGSGISADTVQLFPDRNTKTLQGEIRYLKTLALSGGNRFLLLSGVYRVLHQLTEPETCVSGLLAPAVAYLKEHCTEEVTNGELARKCSISEEYFRKLFRKTYGMPPRQYVIRMRINLAKQLLTEGKLTVSETAERCGFSSSYHFSRLFREKTNETPSAFMNRTRMHEL